MDLLENIREGLRSVRANLLRSVLTALIVAIGITSLVGILTAVDGIEQSVMEKLSSLGLRRGRHSVVRASPRLSGMTSE
jgi:putative ABC transport system permease protein